MTAPRPCRGFVRLQTHLLRAPKPSTHASLRTPHSKRGQRRLRNSPARGARSPRPPELRMWSYGGAVASRGTNPPPPTQGPTRATLTGAEPPERRGAGGRFLWVPARVRSDPNFSPLLSPAAAGERAQTEGAVSPPRRRCWLGPREGRELRPRGPPARAGPHLPSVCGVSVAAAAAAKAHAAAPRAAPTTTAQLGARRGLMLSSAASLPL